MGPAGGSASGSRTQSDPCSSSSPPSVEAEAPSAVPDRGAASVPTSWYCDSPNERNSASVGPYSFPRFSREGPNQEWAGSGHGAPSLLISTKPADHAPHLKAHSDAPIISAFRALCRAPRAEPRGNKPRHRRWGPASPDIAGPYREPGSGALRIEGVRQRNLLAGGRRSSPTRNRSRNSAVGVGRVRGVRALALAGRRGWRGVAPQFADRARRPHRPSARGTLRTSVGWMWTSTVQF